MEFLEGPLIEPYSKFVKDVNHNGYGRLDHPDAHMVAAAPDLYAALDALLCMVDLERNDQPGEDETPVVRARAALAKARGET